MTLSYKVIKKHQIDARKGLFEIPLVPAKEFLKSIKRNAPISIEKIENPSESKILREKVLEQTEAQTRSIVEEAQKQAQEIKRSAQEKGYQKGVQRGEEEGYQIGKEKALQETKQMKAAAKQSLCMAHQESREYIQSIREEIIALAISMAESIMHLTIDTNQESIIKMIKSALHQAEERKHVLFRSSPSLISILKANVEEFQRVCPNAKFTFLEDQEIGKYGCIVETEEQVINLDVDQQLENIKNALLGMRENHEV